MRIDLYTKIVLTVIAVMLTLIACKPLTNPDAAVRAEGPFAGVQFTSRGNEDFTAFDARTGDIWYYQYVSKTGLAHTTLHYTPGYHVSHMGKLGKLGDLPVGTPDTTDAH
jgi:hypothetical protein